MDLNERRVWQQASGRPPRSFANLCLRLGIILNGYDEEVAKTVSAESDLLAEETWSGIAEGSVEWISKLTCSRQSKDDLTRFCHEMKPGDLVVLRRGTATLAVDLDAKTVELTR